MTRLLNSGWFAAVIGAVLYGVVTAVVLNPTKVASRAGALGPNRQPALRPSWEFFNPEVDRLIAELKQEKETLASRKQQLDDFAARLDAERAELNIVTQAVHQMQMDFDRHMVRVQEEEEANLKRLAKTYAAMSPEGAAKIFEEMEDEQIVRIMVFMKESEVAEILELFALAGDIQTKRVAIISEMLRTALFRHQSGKK